MRGRAIEVSMTSSGRWGIKRLENVGFGLRQNCFQNMGSPFPAV